MERPEQEQGRINKQKQLKDIDDVFHNVIIALERLENFLEIHRSGESAAKLATTGIHSARDRHDDQNIRPNLELVLSEVQVQCSTLFFQTKFDDDEFFKQTMKYFMTDLLEWYGGRCKELVGKEIPYDEVERYVLPILVSLSRQIDSVVEIMKVCDEYVVKLRRIEDFSDEEKRKAVEEGFAAFLKARHLVGEETQAFLASGAEVELSVHRRGSASAGYERLIDAMLSIYDTTTPAKKVRDTFTAYVEGLPEFPDDMLDNIFNAKKKNQEKPNQGFGMPQEHDQEQETTDDTESQKENEKEL